MSPNPEDRAVAVYLPDPGAAEATVVGWHVVAGDEVEPDEPLVEILIPGVVIDVPSPVAGRLRSVVAAANQRVRPGELLGWIET